MQNNTRTPYILGLDLGTNSIGWAVLGYDRSTSSNANGLIDAGVRIFPEGRDPKSGTSNAADRRSARGARRLRRRRKKANPD